MSDIPIRNGPDDGVSIGPGPDTALPQERPVRRRRRGLRIALVTLASFVVLIGGVAAGGYFYLNHLAGSIQRIPVKFAAVEPAGRLRLRRRHDGADHRQGHRAHRSDVGTRELH